MLALKNNIFILKFRFIGMIVLNLKRIKPQVYV